jgi:hypothetical protein
MVDLNDIKRINDSHGHTYSAEADPLNRQGEVSRQPRLNSVLDDYQKRRDPSDGIDELYASLARYFWLRGLRDRTFPQ